MRFPRRSFAAVFFIILVATLFAGRGIGKLSVEKCLICHGKPEFRKVFVDGLVKDLYVTKESLKGSIHEKKDCSDCHFDVT